VALVTTNARLAQSMLDRITDGIGRDGEVELLSRRIEWFHPEGDGEEGFPGWGGPE